MDMFDDAFGSAPAIAAPSSDPAADFINREQVGLCCGDDIYKLSFRLT
jgi:hypothetical protein